MAEALGPPSETNPRSDAALDLSRCPFGALTPADYDALGLLVGLEVHQQILTRGKLFCRCPAGLRSRQVDAEVLRHMRPTLSELGEYDGTALMEFKTRKEIVYRLARRSVCTYELDDTPPFPIDSEAVRIAIEVARLYALRIVGELHVMRKQYLDGSIPTGFQRTAMVGLGGEIPFTGTEAGGDRGLRIRQLSLEEDSCREVSDVEHRIIYRPDRLGMPLTETVTEPEITTPLDAARAVCLLARVARATGKVRRGPGSARQDVNVSVAGGRRVEIKGVPSHRWIPALVHNEGFRQLELLRIREELRRRGVSGDDLRVGGEGPAWERSPHVAEVTSHVLSSAHRTTQEAVEDGAAACAVRLPGFGGLLDHTLQPGLPFAYELSERVRVIACLPQPALRWSTGPDEDSDSELWRKLEDAVSAEGPKGDAVVLVWGPREDVDTACREVMDRAREALAGVPAETRQPHPDGTTGFERILPGPDRMYPDTDTPPVPLADELLEGVEASLPEAPWERVARYERLGLRPREAEALAAAPWAGLFDALDPAPTHARRVAGALGRRIPQHWRETGRRDLPEAERLAPLVEALTRRPPLLAALDDLVLHLLRNPERAAEELIAPLERPGEVALDACLRGCAEESRGLRTKDPEAVMRWAMGRVFSVLRGRIEPGVIRARIAGALNLDPSP